jgi:hypothetical protein
LPNAWWRATEEADYLLSFVEVLPLVCCIELIGLF